MSAGNAALRALIVYGLVLPLALIMGYMLATPGDAGTMLIVTLVLGVLLTPMLLRAHHALLVLTWNMTAAFGFLPGRPEVWLMFAFGSLTVSIIQRTMVREQRFLSAPPVVWPMIALALVVLVTAQLTGGLGMRVFGSGNYGGRRYLLIMGAIAGYFALTAQRIPAEKAGLYVGLFFLGSIANMVSSLVPYGPTWLYWLGYIFPIGTNDLGGMASELGLTAGFQDAIGRLFGLGSATFLAVCFCIARWGLRDLLSGTKLWRLVLVVALTAACGLSGFRTFSLLIVLTLIVAFVTEGLLRSKHIFTLFAFCLLGGAVLVSLGDRLPLSIQRSISFLPIKIDPIARYDAENSSNWRLEMWRLLEPEIPSYLWLGKGLSIDSHALEMANEMGRQGRGLPYEGTLLSGDFHSGPLTTIIPFGIWGALAWIWLVIASIKVLNQNRLYGDESLAKINTFLLAYFIARVIFFLVAFGNFYTDLACFTGVIGLSISLNGGICRRTVPETAAQAPVPFRKVQPSLKVSPGFVR